MYGNFCGPWWSDGKFQESVIPTLAAVDDLDETCRDHDRVYALGGDLYEADKLFFNRNFGKGVVETLFAVPVGIQATYRAIDNRLTSLFTNNNTMQSSKKKQTPNLRGAGKAVKIQAKPGLQTMMSTPPVSYGTSIKAFAPKVQRSLTNARMQGRDFIGTVEGQGVSTFGLGKSALLSPAYFQSTVLGNLARSFERYRWNKLRVHYVPKVATSVTGQIILCSQRSVSEPGLQPEAGTFLPRSMSQGNASFGPLWAPSYIDIDCDSAFRNVDPATTADPDDCIHEELQVYTQVNSAQQVGYLFAEYDISFEEPVYQPHSTSIPISTGPGVRVVLTDQATYAVNDDIALLDAQNVLSLATTPNGTIYRMVFDLQGSTAPTGTTFANLANTIVAARATTTTTTATATQLAFVGGMTLYAVVVGSALQFYTSLDAAVNGSGTGQVFARTLSTVANGSYQFDCAVIRYGVSTLSTVQ